MEDEATRNKYPIQVSSYRHPGKSASVNRALYMKAYEVYCHVFSPHEALVKGDCRGGFGVGEFVAFLYASGFPRSEWRARVDEALVGFDIGRN